MEKKQTNWIQTNLPTDCDTVIGFWILSSETFITRNFFIDEKKCYVQDFSGEWVEAPIPDYWKYFYDEPDWMEND